MRHEIFRYGLPILAVLALLVPAAMAQQGPGPGRFADAEHRYDPETVTTVSGTVEEVLLKPGRGGATGLHLLLAADGDEQLEVIVGPTFYVYPEGLEVDGGDTVTVTGSRLTVDGHAMLMAREIQVGDFGLTLRDESGLPAWRGQGPGTMSQRGDGPGPGPGMGPRGDRMGDGGRGCQRGRGRHGRGCHHGCRGYRSEG